MGVITSAPRSLRCKSPALLSSLRRLEQIRRPAQGDAHQNCGSRSDCRQLFFYQAEKYGLAVIVCHEREKLERANRA
jgi:hypothetical protein